MSEKRIQRPYTKADTDLLRHLFASGHSDIRIAKTLGRTPGSVCARRAYLGLYRYARLADRQSRVSSRAKWTGADTEQLRSLVADGKSDHEIAVILGCPSPSIGARRRKLGIPSVTPPGRPRSVDVAKIEAARARIASGARVAEVAADLGMKPGNLYWRLRVDYTPTI